MYEGRTHNAFGEEVLRLLEERGWSVEDLAARMRTVDEAGVCDPPPTVETLIEVMVFENLSDRPALEPTFFAVLGRALGLSETSLRNLIHLYVYDPL